MDQAILERPPHGVAKSLKAERTAKQSAAELAAAAFLHSVSGDLYALDDMARRFHKSPFTFFTVYVASDAISERIRRRLQQAVSKLQEKHPAIKQIVIAITAMEGMDEALISFSDGEGKTTAGKPVVGKVMRAFMIQAAQAIGRAEIACGCKGDTTGYLNEPDLDPSRAPE